MDELSPLSESDSHGDTGEPYPGLSSPPFETKDQTPFASLKWDSTKSGDKITNMVSKGVTLTLKITPYAIMIWLFAPAELKYEARKHLRYLPWAVKYAVWWLKQNG
jgi:hypothetical protein